MGFSDGIQLFGRFAFGNAGGESLAIYLRTEYTEMRGLVYYSANTLGLLRRAATYVDKILKGAKPVDLPAQQPKKFAFIILKTAKQIGLTITGGQSDQIKFWILDCGERTRKLMNEKSWLGFLISFSDSPESKIRNRQSLALSVIAFVLVVTGAVAQAQQPKKAYRIGYLSQFELARESSRSEKIRVALRELGYVEGQNITIEYRYAEGKPDRFLELAVELVRLQVDIIVAAGGSVIVQAAKNATKTIPIVMMGGGLDPVEARPS